MYNFGAYVSSRALGEHQSQAKFSAALFGRTVSMDSSSEQSRTLSCQGTLNRSVAADSARTIRSAGNDSRCEDGWKVKWNHEEAFSV